MQKDPFKGKRFNSFKMRVSLLELSRWDELAKLDGITKTEYIREIMLKEYRRRMIVLRTPPAGGLYGLDTLDIDKPLSLPSTPGERQEKGSREIKDFPGGEVQQPPVPQGFPQGLIEA